MYEQHMASIRGETFDDALFFIQQAFSIIGDVHKMDEFAYNTYDIDRVLNETTADEYYVEDFYEPQNVTFNIWLFKGEHHFVQCNEMIHSKYAQQSTCKND